METTTTMPTLPPGRPRKRHRSFMAEDKLWDEFKSNAEDEGKATSEVLRELMGAYNSRRARERKRTGQ